LVGMVAALGRWVAGLASGTAQRRRAVIAFAATAFVLVAAAVAGVWALRPAASPTACGQAPGTLRILAGKSLTGDTRLKDIVAQAESSVGVHVEFTEQAGTLDAAKRILNTDLSAQFDAVWLPSNKYLLLHE